MLRCVPRAAALIVVLFGASCFLLPPLEAKAQDQPYSAPIVLQLTIPGAAEPITVTAQIAVALPTGAGSSQPSMLPVTITQAAASQGSVKVISAAPAQPAARPPAAALTAEAEPTAGMLPTPTPQTAAAAPTPTPQPLAGAVNDSANLRTGPGTSYAVAGKAQAGDAASVVGKSADGEWYKLAGGEWIAAFLVDIEDANGLPLADAPSAADSWPRYEMISGAFSFAHPPELETYDESADTVFLSQGDVYGVTLGVSPLAAAADFNLLDSEAAVRAYKLFLTSNADLSFRFYAEGTLETAAPSIYVAGSWHKSGDEFNVEFASAVTKVGSEFVRLEFLHPGSADIAGEAPPILTAIIDSIQPAADAPASAAVKASSQAEAAEASPAAPATDGDMTAAAGVSAAALNQYMVGNALLSLPAPSDKDFDVIELKRTEEDLYLLVRNNTDSPKYWLSLDTVARDADGGMLAVEESLGLFKPIFIGSGEVAFGRVHFSDLLLTDDVVFTYEIDWSEAEPDQSYGSLVVSEVNLVGSRFVGMLRNDSSVTTTGPIGAAALCFDRQGSFLFEASEYTVKDEVAAGGSIPFQIEIRDDCPYYLIFASGHQL